MASRSQHTTCLYANECARAALQTTASQPLYRGAKSSTVLMCNVFSQPKFSECCRGYLYLFQLCALKGSPEAVVDGKGCVWDRCAEPG